MKSKQTLAFLTAMLCFSTNSSAQFERGAWQWGLGGGLNVTRYDQTSFSYFLVGSGTVKVEQQSKIGYQMGLSARYQLHDWIQLIGGLGISKVETHATINETFSFPVLGSTNSMEKIDQRFVLLDIPAALRLNIRIVKNAKSVLYLFLESGVVFQTPLANESRFEAWSNGVLKASKTAAIKPFSFMNVVGLAVDDKHTLSFGNKVLFTNLSENTDVLKVTYTRYFNVDKLKKG
jgi:hypothetical protein